MYVHIPFCVSKCFYCDFLSAPADDLTKTSYVDRLIKEIKDTRVDTQRYELKSIFFGGGTPSVLDEKLLAGILDAIFVHFSDILCDDMEVTLECNPKTVAFTKLQTLMRAGFNRISFGLQSANDLELKKIGRIHNFETFLDNYECARLAGFNNINVDIMFGLPGQTLDLLENTLNQVIKLNPSHISAYSLILEEDAKLYKMITKDELPDEETERKMYYLVKDKLKDNGYSHYEISNFAKAGKESIHNLSYWERKDYLGFGIGAASFFEGKRYKNIDELQTYLSSETVEKIQVEELSREDAMSEFMFLGLRKVRDGVSFDEFEKCFGKKMTDVFGEIISKYVNEGFLKNDGHYLKLTDKGIDVSNVIMADFIL